MTTNNDLKEKTINLSDYVKEELENLEYLANSIFKNIPASEKVAYTQTLELRSRLGDLKRKL